MKKDVQQDYGVVDLGGHGHIGSGKKKLSTGQVEASSAEVTSPVNSIEGDEEPRVARRGSAAHIHRGGIRGLGSVDGPSIFDNIVDGEGLESLMFTASSSRVSRDLSMSPFSRIRNDLEQFVEDSDRDIEARFLDPPKSPLLRNVVSATAQTGSVPNSPLIRAPVLSKEDLNVSENRTVWVGNLEREISEEALRASFSGFGPINSVKIMEGYAFVRFEDALDASEAIIQMNGQVIGRTVIKTGQGRDDSFTSTATASQKRGVQNDANNHTNQQLPFGSLLATRSVWLGNLPPETDERTLSKIFSAYGGIEGIKLVPSKHCAFVNFCRTEQATAAINELEGNLRIGDELVRLGYARQLNPIASTTVAPISTNNSTLLISGPYPNRRSSTGSINFGLPNPSHMDVMNLPGDPPEYPSTIATTPRTIESLRSIFGALNVSSDGFQSAILTPAPKPPVISVSTPSGQSIQIPTSHHIISDDSNSSGSSIDYCWEIPELPPAYFGPDLTPGRIRDYRRHIESMNCKPSEFDLIAMEIIPVAVAASTDPVGNVLVQKLIERGSDELKTMIIGVLEPYLAAIGVHKNGTWVVQKLINWCTLPQHQARVAEVLKPYLVPLLQDQYGNYVIQCCLQFEQGNNQFIIDGLAAQTFRIAISRFGSRAMRSCLESPHTSPKQQKQVAVSILENAGKLLGDPNGVIVMQWLLDSELPGKFKMMLGVIEPIIGSLVGLRFATNLVTKLLTQGQEPEARDRLLDLLNKDPQHPQSPVQMMLKEPTCIQIISKILLSVPSLQRMSFLDALRSALTTIMQAGGNPPPGHIIKISNELKDSKRNAQGMFDLSHLIPTSSESASTNSATPSPQPVIISSKLKAHVESHAAHAQESHFVFGSGPAHQQTGQNHLGSSIMEHQAPQHRTSSNPHNQQF